MRLRREFLLSETKRAAQGSDARYRFAFAISSGVIGRASGSAMAAA
jgi:hypothetical protein